jgi:heme/copper-type cytochrome/quinol oxidase subunit 2
MIAIILLILWLAAVLFTIKAIFELQNMDRNTQLLWTILIVVAPVMGLIIYYAFGDRRRR